MKKRFKVEYTTTVNGAVFLDSETAEEAKALAINALVKLICNSEEPPKGVEIKPLIMSNKVNSCEEIVDGGSSGGEISLSSVLGIDKN